jgi:hypothetical protein
MSHLRVAALQLRAILAMPFAEHTADPVLIRAFARAFATSSEPVRILAREHA